MALTSNQESVGTCSVIGLGKLGTSLAVSLASRGFTVTGVDINPQTVAWFNGGRTALTELQLGQLLVAHRARLRATLQVDEAVTSSAVSFVIVPTPSEQDGSFSLRYVLAAMQAIGRSIAAEQTYHLVVLTSTVLPGATLQEILPKLQEASGKVCARDVGLCYSPLFISLGPTVRDILQPDFVRIG